MGNCARRRSDFDLADSAADSAVPTTPVSPKSPVSPLLSPTVSPAPSWGRSVQLARARIAANGGRDSLDMEEEEEKASAAKACFPFTEIDKHSVASTTLISTAAKANDQHNIDKQLTISTAWQAHAHARKQH